MTYLPRPGPWLPGVHPSTNIQRDPAAYEVMNAAMDPDGDVWKSVRKEFDWSGMIVVDIGAGDAFHLPSLAADAKHAILMEPDDTTRLRAMSRTFSSGFSNVSIQTGSAERTLLDTGSVDFVHARFAYFWGPGCEVGIDEIKRILREGGCFIVIDNDYWSGDFAAWLQGASEYSVQYTPPNKEERFSFWQRHGFGVNRIMSTIRFPNKQLMDKALMNEFPHQYFSNTLQHLRHLEYTYGFVAYTFHKT